MIRGGEAMKRGLRTIAAGVFVLAANWAGFASAETVISVTQVSYDANLRPQCAAVRMNPSAYGSLPSDACALGTSGAYGTDRITKTVYDAAGETAQIIQAYGTSDQRVYATYSYSDNGKVVDAIDANGNRSHNAYDGFDRLSAYYYPSTTRPSGFDPSTQANALATAGGYNGSDYEAYGYDANGNKTSWRRRDGQTIGYGYDNLNREIVSDAPGTSLDIYTGYDGLGHILYKRFGSTSGAGVSYAYDGLGRVTSATDMNGRTLSYLYNEANARTRLTYPDGNWQPYTLDDANRVTFTGVGGGNIMLAYDSLGRLTSLIRQQNGGTATTYGYDAVGRLTGMTNDLAGTGNDVTWSFAYNPASQIMTQGASSTTYDYTETASNTVNQTYDGLNRDAAIAALSGGYDARGNMTYDGVRNFSYDVYNRLLSASGTGTNLGLSYDPEGRLASYASGSTTTQFLYDGVNLIGEYDSSGSMTERYVFGPGTDQPLIWMLNSDVSNPRYIYADYHGSVIGYTDASGNLQDLYKYGPYGEPKNGSNMESWSGLRFRYTGQLILPEAKLYYYKARVYDPVYGRFLQTDPIGSKDDLNLYAYTGDDPINGSDPTGTYNPDIYKRYKTANAQRELMRKYDGADSARNMDKFRQWHQDNVFGLITTVAMPEIKLGGVVGKALSVLGLKGGEAAVSPMARGVASEARVLGEMGLTKNTQAVATAEGKAIPDALTDAVSVEVKDTARVSATTQVRIQTQAAAASGRQSVLVTGEKTTVTGPAQQQFDRIIRRSDLGPQ